MRKVISIILGCVVFILGINTVNAEETFFKTYKEGDLVEVKLNAKETGKFYVIESNGIEDIYLIQEKSTATSGITYTYEEAKNKMEELEKSWSNVSDIYFPEFSDLKISPDPTESGTFTTPAYMIEDSAWMKESGNLDGITGHWVISQNLSKEGTYGVFEDTQKMGIRPVIRVVEPFIVGSMPQINSWDSFVKAFKLAIKEAGMDLEIKSTTDSLVLEGDGIKFEYIYKNGILTLSDSNESIEFIAGFISAYFPNMMKDLFDSVEEKTINGKEYSILDSDYINIKYNKTDDITESESYNIAKLFGYSDQTNNNSSNQEKIVNPKTGVYEITGFVLVILGLGLCISNKKVRKSN